MGSFPPGSIDPCQSDAFRSSVCHNPADAELDVQAGAGGLLPKNISAAALGLSR